MSKQEFQKEVEESILPMIKHQLISAYEEGYKQSPLDKYIKNHKLEGKVIDLGLPSGTLWVVQNESRIFGDAEKLGLQYPTQEQIDELMKCKWHYAQYDPWHGHILGPNGIEESVWDACHATLCLWTADAMVDDDFMVDGTIIELDRQEKKRGEIRTQKSFFGEKIFYTVCIAF